jgi:carbon monoxide dehydrogenase subunit G
VKVEGTYTFAAPQEVVWSTMLDPEVLAHTLPGVQNLEKVADNEYRATMKIRIGPVQGIFSGSVKLSDFNPPESCHILVDGKGAPGFVKGEGDLKLSEDGGSTILSYGGDAQVGGRLASVGQRLIESSTQALIRQSLESLDSQIEARMRGEEEGEVTPVAPPSELEFAAGVTRKMLEDMVPVGQRRDLFRVALTIITLLFLVRTIENWWMNRLANRVADELEERQRRRAF